MTKLWKVIRWILAIMAFLIVAILIGTTIDSSYTAGEYVTAVILIIIFALVGIGLMPIDANTGSSDPEPEHKPKEPDPMPRGYTPTAGTGGYAFPAGYAPWAQQAGAGGAAGAAGALGAVSAAAASPYAEPDGSRAGGVPQEPGSGGAGGVSSAGFGASEGADSSVRAAGLGAGGDGEDIVIDYAAFQEDSGGSAEPSAGGAYDSSAPSAAAPSGASGVGTPDTPSGPAASAAPGEAAGTASPAEDSRAAYQRRIHESMSPVSNLSPDDFVVRDAQSHPDAQAGAGSESAGNAGGATQETVPGIAELLLADAPQLREAAASGEWVNVQLVRKAAGLGKDPNLVVLLGWNPLATIEPDSTEYAALIDFAGKDGALQVREESGALRGTLSMRN